jgi:hypothetical protein
LYFMNPAPIKIARRYFKLGYWPGKSIPIDANPLALDGLFTDNINSKPNVEELS